MNNFIKGNTGEWEAVIGLEIHAQVTSQSKLFSSSSTQFGSEPNTQVSFVDAAMPGMLPVINKKCIEQVVKTGLGINAEINLESVFDRKSYFYADLPQGYQISQFYHPIVGEGRLDIELDSGGHKEIGITRIHLEQDAGKSIHDQLPDKTLIDLNRAGIALMEIVTEPDLRSSEEAAAFMKKLRSILRYLDTCDGNMEQGSLRCDANVSVRPRGSEHFGIRAEIKNLNSIKNIVKAIDYEIQRHIRVLESGQQIRQETRLFNAGSGETGLMRSKEDAPDYRYFPDPDLLPLVISAEYVQKIADNMPELPGQKKASYIEQFGLSQYDASVLVADKAIAKYFEQATKKADAKMLANWITAELFGRLNKNHTSIEESPVSPNQLAELINLIKDKIISGKIAKEVFNKMFETGDDASSIVERESLKQVTNTTELEAMVDQVLADNSDKLEEYRGGKVKLFGYFVGQVMKASQGKANPQLINEIIKRKLS